jgi:hypothetical protein
MMTDQKLSPGLIPGDDLNLSVDDLLLLNGRANASLALEQSKNLALRQAYNQIRADFEAYKENQKAFADAKEAGSKPIDKKTK